MDPVTFFGSLTDKMASSSPVGTARASKSKEPITSASAKSGIVDPVTGESWSGRGRLPARAKTTADAARKHEGANGVADAVPVSESSVKERLKKK